MSKKIKSIELDSKTILEKDVLGEKVGILDIKAKLDGEILCDIELQVVKQDYIEKRMLWENSVDRCV